MRAWLAALVALGLAPGTLVRTVPPVDNSPWASFEPVTFAQDRIGPFELEEAWVLQSSNSDFGSYSALIAAAPGEMLALSDRGHTFRFGRPEAGKARARFGTMLHFRTHYWNLRDFEALTRDPRTGTLWATFEGRHGIARVKTDGREAIKYLSAMRRWGDNSGAEAMVRLRDGRFLVLAERSEEWGGETSPGLLYPTDPVSGGEPLRFRLALSDGYKPTDLAQLPDGRLLLLARNIEVGLPPQFPARLLLADPATIREGGTWAPQPLATIEKPLPSDNFEGLAVEPAADGRAVAWLISDDNRSTLQRTLLLKLSFDPAALGK